MTELRGNKLNIKETKFIQPDFLIGGYPVSHTRLLPAALRYTNFLHESRKQ